jgi:hypothetical protein
MYKSSPSFWRRPTVPERGHRVVERAGNRVDVDFLLFKQLFVEKLSDVWPVPIAHRPF